MGVKEGFPDEGELVMCTVTSVQFHSVFVRLDEYGKTGMIHISEVSPGRIRNIRDYVKEGKKVVCKVLRIHGERNHIDLSLRRVTEAQKRNKVDELKQQQNAEKILEFAIKTSGGSQATIAQAVQTLAIKESGTLYSFFQDVVGNNELINKVNISPKEKKVLLDVIKQRVKPPQVEVKGKLSLESYDPNGVELIKQALQKSLELGDGSLQIQYLGSGTYKLCVVAGTYKIAEKIMEQAVQSTLTFVEQKGGHGNFERMEV